MKTSLNVDITTILSRLFAAAMVFLALFYLDVFGDGSPVYRGIQFVLIPLTAYFVYKMKFSSAELISLILNCAWVFITQAMYHARGRFCFFIFCSCFGGGMVFNAKQREKVLACFTGAVCGVLLIWSLAGIVTVLQGHPIISVPLLTENVVYESEIQPTGVLCFIQYWGIHRNVSASFFVMALGLMAWWWFSCKKKIWRISAAFLSVIFYVSISIQHSRSNYLAAAICIAMAIGIGISEKIKKDTFAKKVIVSFAIILCAALLYAGFDPFSSLLSRIASPFDNGYYEQSSKQSSEETAEDGTAAVLSDSTSNKQTGDAAPASLSDHRDLIYDAKTLTGRTEIWKTVFRAVADRPSVLWKGSPRGEEVREVNNYLSTDVAHMHNCLLQQLMMSGIPGILSYLVYLVLLLVKMIRAYYGQRYTASQKVLVCPLAAIILYGMFEPVLNRPSVTAAGFFLIGGIFVGNMKLIAPRKKLVSSNPVTSLEPQAGSRKA